MLTPSIREDLQLFEGTPLEDGSPTWLLFDTLTNKYFTIGLNAFRLLNYWNADVDTKTFIKNVEQKGVNLKEEELFYNRTDLWYVRTGRFTKSRKGYLHMCHFYNNLYK